MLGLGGGLLLLPLLVPGLVVVLALSPLSVASGWGVSVLSWWIGVPGGCRGLPGLSGLGGGAWG